MLTEVSGGIGLGRVPSVAVKTHFHSRTQAFGFMVWVVVWVVVWVMVWVVVWVVVWVMVVVGAAAHAFAHPCPFWPTFLSALV